MGEWRHIRIFIYQCQRDNISRTLERIESNSKQPYYTTLISEDTLVWLKNMKMIMTEMKLQVKGIVYFFENTSNIPIFKISDTFLNKGNIFLFVLLWFKFSCASSDVHLKKMEDLRRHFSFVNLFQAFSIDLFLVLWIFHLWDWLLVRPNPGIEIISYRNRLKKYNKCVLNVRVILSDPSSKRK